VEEASRYQEQEKGLERKLTPWQLGMIAVGGAIGVGLFLGSGATIGLAGPAVIVTYLMAAVVALIMGCVLAEMASVYPVAGSFGIYADRYIHPWAGFAVRLTYWFAQTLAIGAQVTAVGLYLGYWFPEIPTWVWILASSVLVVAVNAANVKVFGSLEANFSLIKVVAIVVFILLGSALILGLGREAIGFDNLTAQGGFLPNGWSGVWLAMTLVITSYIGVEVVAVTAGEAERPETSVPKALIGMVSALIILYGGAILVVVTVIPWTVISETGGTLTGSPFVKVFREIGIPYAGGVMNFVVISAALTSVNTNLYLCSRMLFSLSRADYVPASLGLVDRRGVPVRALIVSTGGMLLAVILALKGHQAFLPLFGTAVAAMLSIWIVIFISHIRFRRELAPERLAALGLKMPAHPFPTLLAIIVIVAIIASTPFVAGLEWTFPLFVLWLAATGLLYWARRRRGEVHS
jgi:L-asparagine transporter-like permease